LEKEIAALDAENTAGSRLLELRKKQFSLLLHVVCGIHLVCIIAYTIIFVIVVFFSFLEIENNILDISYFDYDSNCITVCG
jgi:hypothetical protein